MGAARMTITVTSAMVPGTTVTPFSLEMPKAVETDHHPFFTGLKPGLPASRTLSSISAEATVPSGLPF